MSENENNIYRQQLRDSENQIDYATKRRLNDAREIALRTLPWYRSLTFWRPTFVYASLLAIVVALPLTTNVQDRFVDSSDVIDQNLQLMIEDPEFYLWLSNSGTLQSS